MEVSSDMAMMMAYVCPVKMPACCPRLAMMMPTSPRGTMPVPTIKAVLRPSDRAPRPLPTSLPTMASDRDHGQRAQRGP